MRRTAWFAVLALLPLLGTACDDPAGARFDPLIVTDTAVIAPPSSAADALPSAIDLTISGGEVGGAFGPGRYPERTRDAGLGWDIAVRATAGGLVFFPAGALGLPFNSGITTRRAEAFEAVERAPETAAGYVTDASVPVEVGAVYVARTRQNRGCIQYSKLRVLDVSAANAVRVEIVGNERCGDPRLLPRRS